MRSLLTYRGARRNAARSSMVKVKRSDGSERPRKTLRFWKLSRVWIDANIKAKIVERQKQAQAAMAAVAQAAAASPRTFNKRDVNTALSKFWLTQPRTRPVHRILVDLGAV